MQATSIAPPKAFRPSSPSKLEHRSEHLLACNLLFQSTVPKANVVPQERSRRPTNSRPHPSDANRRRSSDDLTLADFKYYSRIGSMIDLKHPSRRQMLSLAGAAGASMLAPTGLVRPAQAATFGPVKEEDAIIS